MKWLLFSLTLHPSADGNLPERERAMKFLSYNNEMATTKGIAN